MDEHEAFEVAVTAGNRSGCGKSHRGVVIWRPGEGVVSVGFNAPPSGFECDRSAECRRDCNKICIHAEAYAITAAAYNGKSVIGAEMLHVKVVAGLGVASGLPSCWQCSRTILFAGLSGMWLCEENPAGGLYLRRYSTSEFHKSTLQNCGLHQGASGSMTMR